nr:DNA methyltransferase [Nitrosomonas nitrosa]
MKPIKQNDPETQSPDVVAENIARLKELFTGLVTEGPNGVAVNLDVLKSLVGDATVTDAEEKYGLYWHGKRRARQLGNSSSTGTLLPCPDESVDWDTTKNLIIEGDNLEALKLLQKSYAGKVKLIYIDPPYNTGKDFVYPDDFHDSIANYQMLTGQTDSDGRKISSNTEASGRFHTNWLNMMLPRLIAARSLLRRDGFFVISTDDTEVASVRFLLNEVIGEENFVATLVFDRNRKNDAKLFSVGHEYMVVYARDKGYLAEQKVMLRAQKEGVEEVRAEFDRLRKQHGDNWSEVAKGLKEFYDTFDDDDPRAPLARYTKVDERGPFRSDGNPSWPGGGGPRYDVPHPRTRRACKVPSRGWVWPTYERMKEEIDKGNVIFGPDESTIPGVRMTLFEGDQQVMRSVIFSYAQKASQDFAKLFDGKAVFDNPKSFTDLERLIDYLSEPGDLVLDFFSGSGTTAHGVLLANRANSQQRRFILVQLPEPLDIDDKYQKAAAEFCDLIKRPRVLSEVTKERVRRAAKRIRDENPIFVGDLGFRVFKLDSSNIFAWKPNRESIPEAIEASVEHLKADRTEQDILYELLLKLGLDLCVPIEQKTVVGKAVYSVGAGTLLACLDTRVARDEVEPLALGIVEWHKTLAPAGETTVVFRDSAFADDVAKTNLTAILQQQGLENIRSI